MELTRERGHFLLHLGDDENLVDAGFLRDFERALDAVEASPETGGLVSVGGGSCYSTGLALDSLLAGAPAEGEALLSGLHDLLARLLAFPRPTLAALNGHAFAAGALIALAHDQRLMRSDRGFFCLPELDLATGRPLTDGMHALLEARLCRSAIHELLLTGRRCGGPEALSLGAVDALCDGASLLENSRERVRAREGEDAATAATHKRRFFADALRALERDGSRFDARPLERVDWKRWSPQERATLVFVVEGERVLLIRKLRGLGAGKINGPGGRIEPGESVVECARREVEEEVGVTPTGLSRRGELRFHFMDGYSLHVSVFLATGCRGEVRASDEADPLWTPLSEIPYAEMWEDDELWLPRLLEGKHFDGCFVFEDDRLLDHSLSVHPEA